MNACTVLRFADDVALFPRDKQKLMLEALSNQAAKVGLQMNYTNPQFTTNTPDAFMTKQ